MTPMMNRLKERMRSGRTLGCLLKVKTIKLPLVSHCGLKKYKDPFHALESHRSSPSIARRGTGSGALLDPSQTRTASKSSKTPGLSRRRTLRPTRKHKKVTECLMCPDVVLGRYFTVCHCMWVHLLTMR